MLKNLKIIYDKIYIDDEHIATIRFGQLIVKAHWSGSVIKLLYYVSDKLNLELNLENIK